MILAAVPIQLEVTLPTHHACGRAWRDTLPAGFDRCGPCPVPVPLANLSELAIVGWPIDGGWPDTLARIQVSGMVGETVALTVTLDERPWSLWAIVRTQSSPWSCRSNGLAWGAWPVSVPTIFPGPDLLPRFYDVAGRRLARPPPSGVYFVRIGGETRKRLILR